MLDPVPDTLQLVPYAEARHMVADCDLLAFRRKSLISLAGRGIHSHIGTAVWESDYTWRLICIESRELRGVRIVRLSCLVEKYPGRIDVFEANPDSRWPEYDRERAVNYLWDATSGQYGYVNLLFTALLHCPFLRWRLRPSLDDRAVSKRPPYCSMLRSAVDRAGGVDPVPFLGDACTEPADLVRSPFYRYRFTLMP